MKAKYLIMICAAALALLSCRKEAEDGLKPVNQEGTTVISADIESLLLGEDERVWPEGSYIGVFGSASGINEKYVLKRAGAGLSSAEFYGPMVSGETLSAYYPWSGTYTGSAVSMPASLSERQQYSGASAVEAFLDNCPRAYASMKAGKMKFFYPFGLLRVRVELFESMKVTSMRFVSATSPAAGLGEILPDGSFNIAGVSYTEVTLDCPGGVETKVEEEITDFYITLFPGTYEIAALVIEAEGEDPVVCTLNGITIRRIAAEGFALTSVSVRPSGPEGFTVIEKEFD